MDVRKNGMSRNLSDNDAQVSEDVCDIFMDVRKKRRLGTVNANLLNPDIFKDDSLTTGGQLKDKGEVLVEHEKARCRAPNTTCRVEMFSRISQQIEELPKQWVKEMGFEALLNFVGEMHLPRQLCYWLMSRVDPYGCSLRCRDGREFRISPNQVHLVLGIPNVGKDVPTYQTISEEKLREVDAILSVYGKEWKSKSRKTGKVYTSVGIPVNKDVIERLKGKWHPNEEVQFKTLFLLASLEMVLCPTQSSRLASDLVPALTCASSAAEYDWCTLVVKKLMDSVVSFARRFYLHGYASGCGGCLYFLVVLYLDRLNRDPLKWGYFPRLEVWGMSEIRKAIKEDRFGGGDFGAVGTVDVAYGEAHPALARDSNGPIEEGVAKGKSFGRICVHEKCAGCLAHEGNDSTGEGRTVGLGDEKKVHAIHPNLCCYSGNDCMDYLKFEDGGELWASQGIICRWISDGAVCKLRRIISWVLRVFCSTERGEFPHSVCLQSAELVAFHGSVTAEAVCKVPTQEFIDSCCSCSYLAVVSEMVVDLVPYSSVCIVVKSRCPGEYIMIQGNSTRHNLTVLRKKVSSSEELIFEIECCQGVRVRGKLKTVLIFSGK